MQRGNNFVQTFIIMTHVSFIFVLLLLGIVNSGNSNHNYMKKNSNTNNNRHIKMNSPLSSAIHGSGINSTRIVNSPVSSKVHVYANKKQEEESVQSKQQESMQSNQQEQQQQIKQQPQQQQQQELQQRAKRAATNLELDEAEIARQNQITQQIFAKYLERRLFPNRSTNEHIPTISEILPKPSITTTTAARPKPRGFATSANFHNFRRNISLKTPARKRYGYDRRKQINNNRHKSVAKNQQLVAQIDYDEEEEEKDEQHTQSTLKKPELYIDISAEGGGVTGEGQEALQSVESEQHDRYYNDLLNRDPRDNEIDSDCPNCVDESQYTNKWTMPLLKLGEKRYYLGIFFKANWFKAAQYCRYHGMHLVSISSQEENDRLEKHIRDFGLGHEHFWTSGTDLADEGNYFWMANGRPITFTNWNAGEPNNFRYENGEEENCMELWNRDGKGLKWNDSPCSFETYFVCEVQAV
ncbi:uncharacterized protein tfc isoform X2 [Eurosta solidaginis]|uniref:uncharacterized protein tfc isoform X2 n=1 Tax=Eurosta solidaginis TaxID=178769 RepID=UPI0035307901